MRSTIRSRMAGGAALAAVAGLLLGCEAKQPDYGPIVSRVESAANKAEAAASKAEAAAKAAAAAAERAQAAASKAEAQFGGHLHKK